jgi:hypothetical protein
MNDLNSQIANMQNTGYGTAMQAATARQNLLNQLGATAGNVSAACASAKNVAGANLANLGKTTTDININCAELLSKLGAECQTIQQNAQCFDLSKLCRYAGIVGKNQVPTGTSTTLCMSPFSTAAALGAGALGIYCNFGKISDAVCKTWCAIKGIFGPGVIGSGFASGGLVGEQNNCAVGCASQRNLGALPCRR